MKLQSPEERERKINEREIKKSLCGIVMMSLLRSSMVISKLLKAIVSLLYKKKTELRSYT